MRFSKFWRIFDIVILFYQFERIFIISHINTIINNRSHSVPVRRIIASDSKLGLLDLNRPPKKGLRLVVSLQRLVQLAQAPEYGCCARVVPSVLPLIQGECPLEI